jgi:hypothetical protein
VGHPELAKDPVRSGSDFPPIDSSRIESYRPAQLSRPIRSHLFLLRLQLQIPGFDLNPFLMDIEPQIRKPAHTHIRHPDQGEQGNQISSPIRDAGV